MQETQEIRVQSLVRKTPGEANGNPLQYSRLGAAMDRGAWQATVIHDLATEHEHFGVCLQGRREGQQQGFHTPLTPLPCSRSSLLSMCTHHLSEPHSFFTQASWRWLPPLLTTALGDSQEQAEESGVSSKSLFPNHSVPQHRV